MLSEGDIARETIRDDWREIGRVLAVNRGPDWDAELPDDFQLGFGAFGEGERPAVIYDYGDRWYTLDPDSGRVHEGIIEEDGVLVSVFDPDGELRQTTTVPLAGVVRVDLDESDQGPSSPSNA